MRFWLRTPLFEEQGEGTGGSGGTDTPTLTLELVQAEINKAINGFDKRSGERFKKLETGIDALVANLKPKDDNKDGEPDKKQPKADPFTATKLTEAEKRIQALEEENTRTRKAAEEKEMDAEVKSALSSFQFNDGGKDVAYDFYRGKIKRSEEGELVIGEMSAAKYISEHVPRSLAGLLAPKQVGGSGAKASSGKGGADLDKIKPGMSKEDAAEIAAAIRAALPH